MSTIVFIHGLNSENNLFETARFFFTSKGFTIKEFRLKKNHSYTDTKITTISKKLLHILHSLKKSNQEILVIGHSLGSIAPIITSEINTISKLILWDASLNPYDVLIHTKKSYNIEIHQNVIDDASKYKNLQNYFKKINVPTLLIGAGKGGHKLTHRYYEYFQECAKPKKIIIENADHNFSDTSSINQLLYETYLFIKKSTSVRKQWWNVLHEKMSNGLSNW